MFTELRLENFKGWEDTGPIRLAPITLFFGSNSSGKTSLLQSILLLRQTAATSDRSRVLNTGDERSLVDLGTPTDLIYGHQTDRTLGISLRWTPRIVFGEAWDLESLGFRVEVMLTTEGQPVIAGFSYDFAENSVGMARREGEDTYDLVTAGVSLKRRKGRPWPLPRPIRFYGFPDEAQNYYQDAQWLLDLVLELERQLSGVQYVGPLREYPKRVYLWAGDRPESVGTRGEQAVAALLAARADKRKIPLGEGKGRRYPPFEAVIAAQLQRMGVIDSFEVLPIAPNRKDYEVRVRRSPGSPEVLLTDVGFGVSQLLPVIVQSYYAATGSTVIFEQPEIHLHPRVQADLADVIVDAMRRCGVQFIIESHSEHFLRRLQRRIAEAETITSDEVALYRCDEEGGRSTLQELCVDEYGNITNWPKDFFGDEMGDLAAMTKAGIRRRREEKEKSG
ncbi:MAG TPA: DUF3696 domain-containing protein [Candidatus Nanopelagicales bacterium]|nr:DUF3696 domain-containing protein [Candidatus Nanopelagicales bacterium]